MKPATIIGLIPIVIGIGIGIVGFAVGGFSFTHQKHDAKLGTVDIFHKSTSTTNRPTPSPSPILSGIALVVVGVKQ